MKSIELTLETGKITVMKNHIVSFESINASSIHKKLTNIHLSLGTDLTVKETYEYLRELFVATIELTGVIFTPQNSNNFIANTKITIIKKHIVSFAETRTLTAYDNSDILPIEIILSTGKKILVKENLKHIETIMNL